RRQRGAWALVIRRWQTCEPPGGTQVPPGGRLNHAPSAGVRPPHGTARTARPPGPGDPDAAMRSLCSLLLIPLLRRALPISGPGHLRCGDLPDRGHATGRLRPRHAEIHGTPRSHPPSATLTGPCALCRRAVLSISVLRATAALA